jgi:hypothetical protein
MPRHLGRTFAIALGSCLLACGACASGPSAAPAEARPSAIPTHALPEPAALTLIDRLLVEQRQLPAFGWRVRLADQVDFEVDVRLGASRFGIEWVSARDRVAEGVELPEPDPHGQLRVVRAVEASEPALILVLDDRSYRVAGGAYEARAQSERALEHRLRRDLQDFVAFAQTDPRR